MRRKNNEGNHVANYISVSMQYAMCRIVAQSIRFSQDIHRQSAYGNPNKTSTSGKNSVWSELNMLSKSEFSMDPCECDSNEPIGLSGIEKFNWKYLNHRFFRSLVLQIVRNWAASDDQFSWMFLHFTIEALNGTNFPSIPNLWMSHSSVGDIWS